MSQPTSPELIDTCKVFLTFIAESKKWTPTLTFGGGYFGLSRPNSHMFIAHGQIAYEGGQPDRFRVVITLYEVRPDLLVVDELRITGVDELQKDVFLSQSDFCRHTGYLFCGSTTTMTEESISKWHHWAVHTPKSIEMLLREYDATARLYRKEPVFCLPER